MPEERICNSQLHPRCNNLKIDSVDPRTGMIDHEHGKKRRSNRNKKKREKDLLDDPTTEIFGRLHSCTRAEGAISHFDREVAADQGYSTTKMTTFKIRTTGGCHRQNENWPVGNSKQFGRKRR